MDPGLAGTPVSSHSVLNGAEESFYSGSWDSENPDPDSDTAFSRILCN